MDLLRNRSFTLTNSTDPKRRLQTTPKKWYLLGIGIGISCVQSTFTHTPFSVIPIKKKFAYKNDLAIMHFIKDWKALEELSPL